MYGPRAGFSWLVLTEDGWSGANVLPEWPMAYTPGAPAVVVDKVQYAALYSYEAEVTYAVGAFNWRVSVGDTAQVAEFQAGQLRLAAETTDSEMTWSRSSPVSADQLAVWFGASFKGKVKAPSKSKPFGNNRYRTTAKFFIYAVIVVLFSAGSSWTRLTGGGGMGRSYGGSAWSSHTGGGGGSWGGGSGGGGHK
ncbi:conserved hypothetical protein [Ricinus communis]|uniref:DUF4178 domain-containing protein n=1 Tax=Ricinus communis TaxID=3988 RepID=B9TPF1_RICCO|nr:conserved hypothetical protein [Ricinus communis]